MPVPDGWEEAHDDDEIRQCVWLFNETDSGHYGKMNLRYCQGKIGRSLMHLWRRTDIAWDNEREVRQRGVAMAYFLWRLRSGETITEYRWVVCLFLGSGHETPDDALVVEIIETARAFARSQGSETLFYIVKERGHQYPRRVDRVFNHARVQRLRQGRPDAPPRDGWPDRNVWYVNFFA